MMSSSTGEEHQEQRYDSICQQCRKFLGLEGDDQSSNSNDSTATCPVCLGLWDCKDRLIQQFHKSCEPYGGVAANYFSATSPTVLLPGDVTLRYMSMKQSLGRSASTWNRFQNALKDHLKDILAKCIDESPSNDEKSGVIHKEEQGYLLTHLFVAPPKHLPRPSKFFHKPPRRNRKRFRGNDPTLKQAGDPLVNQQQRITAKEGLTLWTTSEIETAYTGASQSVRESVATWVQEELTRNNNSEPATLHVVMSRQPFIVRALYTKARRDVSQTPFYVPDKDASSNGVTVMKRLGTTSVEEQIVPALTAACGGISTQNNEVDADVIVYGMVKFHASGREDMNVRMTLPPGNDATSVGGRPFCCEVIDALRMPVDLKPVVIQVNHSDNVITTNPEDGTRTYGTNPFGVGISSCLSFVPAFAFKNLQSDTEEKIKYYGCHCWSEAVIPSQEYLNDKLSQIQCPIALKQRTPVRVLHRRPNIHRTRHVMSLTGARIDDHYFRLSLSTDAGTYVKEFVHGDLGRTVPNVSILLGTKTDILLLDCEGIQQG